MTNKELPAELPDESEQPKNRFIIIAIPEDSGEDLEEVSDQLEVMLDLAQISGVRTVVSDPQLTELLRQHLGR